MNQKKHPLYRRWNSILSRCYNSKNANYKYYGAKGVIVDSRWHDFDNFVYDVDNHLLNGYLLYKGPQWQLDKDIKGGNIYSLENCTVLSAEDNFKLVLKKSQKKIIAFNDSEEITFSSISEASRKLKITRPYLHELLKNGKKHKSGYCFKYNIEFRR